MRRFSVVVFVVFSLFWGVRVDAQENSGERPLSAPSWVQTIEVQSGTREGAVYRWNIVSATRPPDPLPPREDLRDFATLEEPTIERVSASPDNSKNSSPRGPLADSNYRQNEQGEDVPAFWEAIAPATYTIEFATPFELYQIDLAPPLRKIGFSDFETLIQSSTDEAYHPIIIDEATTSRGASLEAGYLWEFRIRPEKVHGVKFEFKKGTLDFPDRIFLKDLDLWGK
ncbi:MAG: hypothetical protein KC917_11625 [Candidatus Omnitrophica bacterium]|nr:hypothetical protein [Candidatus Omnitrophota bacterium]MCA9416917.1 hypothetical protein [Candidatus Omnitrophota bacterium]